MPISPARTAAFEALLRIENTSSYASDLLNSSRFAKLSPADHGLLTELVMGVLRWRSVLDEQIAKHSRSALSAFDLAVLISLRLGTYQLLLLDRVPAHAAVDESVELVKRARKRSAAGLVNAVLRKMHRQDFPLPSGCSAHPEWLVNRWNRNYGPDVTLKICEYDQTSPAAAVRIVHSAIIQDLRQNGICFRPGSLLSHAFRVSARDITHTQAFEERRLVLQDEASQLVALLVGQGNSILDCCAAPGGKTRILAEQNPRAEIIAMDVHPHRARLFCQLVAEPNVRAIAADARAMPLARKFDRVLVDVPCSGTGTLARNPEIKWRLKSEDLRRLQQYQLEIVLAAMKHVAPGGRLIYSTCSLEPEENEVVINKGLTENSSFAVLDAGKELTRLQSIGELAWKDWESLLSGPYLRIVPGVHPCDGFFAAILENRN